MDPLEHRELSGLAEQIAPLTVSRPELMSNGSDADFRTLVHNLLAFSSRLEAVRQSFGAIVGLSGIQYTTLISILHLQGEEGVGVNALADHLSLSGPFVTIETGRLVKLGLVHKRVNPTDRRRVLLTVTVAGRALLDGLAPLQRDVNDTLFEPLATEDFRTLGRIAGTLVQSAGRAVALSEYLSGRRGEAG